MTRMTGPALIRLQTPLKSGKAFCFLEIEKQSPHESWYFFSLNPIRRKEMRSRGAKNVINPKKQKINDIRGSVWIDEWQSFLGEEYHSLLYDLFSGQGVKIIVISQSFRLKNEQGYLAPFLRNIETRYYCKKRVPKHQTFSSKELIEGIGEFFGCRELVITSPSFPARVGKSLFVAADCLKESQLLSMARHYKFVGIHLPRTFCWRSVILKVFLGHADFDLINSAGEDDYRGHINKEATLSRQAFDWGVLTKKWQKGIHSLLWWSGWWQKNEAHDA